MDNKNQEHANETETLRKGYDFTGNLKRLHYIKIFNVLVRY